MPIFGPFILQLSAGDRERLDKIAKATESLGKTADALLAKLNEPTPPDPDNTAELNKDADDLDAAAKRMRDAQGTSTP